MKKISYSLVLIVVAGILISVFWANDRYFKKEEGNTLSFVVERGDIEEVVLVRGEVVPQRDFDLEFSFSGTVDRIFVNEGDNVTSGEPLVRLDTTDFRLELEKLEAVLAQTQANLKKLVTGATEEDINVSETKVENAMVSLEDAKKDLVNKLQDAYVKSDDSVRNNVDQLFSNPQSSNPQINVTVSDGQLRVDVETRRLVLENLFDTWDASLNGISTQSDLTVFVNDSNRNLEKVREFLDRVALLVNTLNSSSSLSQTTIDGYKSDISTARTNVNTAITNMATAEEKLRKAESDLSLAEQELELKISGAREEDLAIAEAGVKEIESQMSIVRENIRKSTLYAPGFVKVEKIWIEKGEIFRPGNTVVSLSTPGFKIQADLSELEIGKISESNGNDALIELDAFSRKIYTGKVVSIEPRKVVKDGDTYYKINVFLDAAEKAIRTGMSADITISISSKDGVLYVPDVVVFEKGDKDFIVVLEDGEQVEKEVEIGISDGENVEIVSGVSEGDIVVISIN